MRGSESTRPTSLSSFGSSLLFFNSTGIGEAFLGDLGEVAPNLAFLGSSAVEGFRADVGFVGAPYAC